jgi:hypothetical protein
LTTPALPFGPPLGPAAHVKFLEGMAPREYDAGPEDVLEAERPEKVTGNGPMFTDDEDLI